MGGREVQTGLWAHSKELFLWALAFECGMGIIPLGNGEPPRSEDPTVWMLPDSLRHQVPCLKRKGRS